MLERDIAIGNVSVCLSVCPSVTVCEGRGCCGCTACWQKHLFAMETATVSSSRRHCMLLCFNALLSRRSRQRERLSASVLSICSSVCLSVPKMHKRLFSQKVSNLELLSLLTTYRKSYMGFSKNPLLDF